MSNNTIDPKQAEAFLVLNPDFLSNEYKIKTRIDTATEKPLF